MEKAAILDIQGLSIGYPRPGHSARVVAADISVSLHAGEFVCLLGPNGAGKSTLIRSISRIQPQLAGTVRLNGRNIVDYPARELAQCLSLVLTQRAAVGVMPAVTLVSMGRHPFTGWSGRLSRRDHEAVHNALVAVGILDLAMRPVCELSDGERQKVMIARALAQDPQVMILDEATAFLDLPHRVELMHLLRKLALSGDRAILLSTHDLDLALRNADRLWLLSPDGTMRQGAPEDLILTDAFAEAFAHGGVQFDKASGSFMSGAANMGRIALEGEGVAAIWTCRALERAGYQVVDPDGAPVCVQVYHGKGEISWKIKNGGAVWCHSIEELLGRLRPVHDLTCKGRDMNPSSPGLQPGL